MTITTDFATPPTACSVSLQRLIASVRQVVRSESDSGRIGQAVAELLRPHLTANDFLTPAQLEPDPIKYRQHVLHVEPDGSFSVVALVWLPGQCTCIHDHVSWCVVGVHQGQEHETVYAVNGEEAERHLRVTTQHINPAGSVMALVPPGDIHHVANHCDGLAVSLHVYGADIRKLGSSIRRRYDLEVRPTA